MLKKVIAATLAVALVSGGSLPVYALSKKKDDTTEAKKETDNKVLDKATAAKDKVVDAAAAAKDKVVDKAAEVKKEADAAKSHAASSPAVMTATSSSAVTTTSSATSAASVTMPSSSTTSVPAGK